MIDMYYYDSDYLSDDDDDDDDDDVIVHFLISIFTSAQPSPSSLFSLPLILIPCCSHTLTPHSLGSPGNALQTQHSCFL
jgi:hypothetical protein